MQALYDAIIALGRSADDARNGGWLCEDIGTAKSPKCVNGLITWHLGWHKPEYITKMLFGDMGEMRVLSPLTAPALIAGRALLSCIPEAAWPLLEDQGIGRILDPDTVTDHDVEQILISVNDLMVGTGEFEINDDGSEYELQEPFLGSVGAADWFDRALDLLAQQLPDPLPATPPLTVADVLAEAPAPELVLT